jgi:hypothetical protein
MTDTWLRPEKLDGGTSMLNLIRLLAMLSTLLIVGCASGPSGKSFDSAIGEWSWTFGSPSGRVYSGEMTIIDETKATTTFKNGRIFFYAIDGQGKWEGHWVAETLKKPCSDKKDGSIYWGVAIFQFNDAYNSFKGTYDFCGDGGTFFWDGVRL